MFLSQSKALGMAGVLLVGVFACRGLAHQGVAERVGQKLDRVGKGIKQGTVEVSDAVRRKYENVQSDVRRMETHNRVYARIHWDKTFYQTNIEVLQLKEGAILLRGLVPDPAAKDKAMELALDTFGVTDVIDELTVAPPPPPVKPTTTTKGAIRPKR